MKGRLTIWISCIFLMLAITGGCKKTPALKEPAVQNPQLFTTAVRIDLPGCGNLYKVSDILYRGEQPTAEGFKELQKLGIKTVVNLRWLHSDRDELKGCSLDYIEIPMQAWDPEQEEVEEFLKIVTDPQKQPVFVHCQHGADRTGTMTAVYRIVVEGWEPQKAIDEMRYGPFGFHEVWTGLPKFIEKLNVEGLRSKYGSQAKSQESGR